MEVINLLLNRLKKILCIEHSSSYNRVINIAVVGRSGVGKSSFINAIRGDLDLSHPNYAETGVNECTSKRQSYPHPDNERLIFWDLPGVGTPKFPRRTYLKHKEVKLSSYDSFVLMTCDRFTEDDGWLASEIKKGGKPVLFVRSMVDCQIKSDKIQKEKAKMVSNPFDVIEEIREDCRKNCEKCFGKEFKDIYLIDSLDLQNTTLDFHKILARVLSMLQN